ncbi:hypothetical protein D9615_003345 [Tricholomella constricta]|uniref:Yeast cell wall synthesis Kre9/Knh1-like N-terminal domain-containing protein n=1 Tax=Tricholomella constricta TaxID=117010 RepID=A0A8H5HJF6_9AGAR|nr:hypothetical protein D9615_003345 [Tricholomella constricta]
MYSTTLALVLAFWILNFALLADAGVYVLKPEARSKCHGGKACTIEWLDDGIQPLLSAAGLCTFGLYTGKQKLVQALPPADVSLIHSVTFKPNPAAGPNSDAYYIGIISTTFKDNSSAPYIAFSPFFSIDDMTGSFDNPLPEATSAILIPSSFTPSTSGSGTRTATSHSTTTLSTITVGTLSTSLPPLPTPTSTKPATTQTSSSSSTAPLPSQTRLTTSILSSSTPIVASSTGTSPPASITSSLSNGTRGRTPPIQTLATAFLIFLAPSLLSFF